MAAVRTITTHEEGYGKECRRTGAREDRRGHRRAGAVEGDHSRGGEVERDRTGRAEDAKTAQEARTTGGRRGAGVRILRAPTRLWGRVLTARPDLERASPVWVPSWGDSAPFSEAFFRRRTGFMSNSTNGSGKTAELLLIDFSGLAHQLWHVSGSEPDPSYVSTQLIARVRALASQHPHAAICCDSGKSFRHDLEPTY